MKKVKLLFQGDSITDWGRDYNDIHNLGYGYALYAAENLVKMFPDVEFEFIDLGVSGRRTHELFNHIQDEFVDIQPDICSILIGINDVWHVAAERKWFPHNEFEGRYRAVLEALKNNTKAKIMMMEPFLIPVEDKLFFREDLDPKIQVVRKLAREYADVYLPTDGLLHSAIVGDDMLSYAGDGVHPTEKGARYIGKLYAEYVKPLVEKVIAEQE